MLDVNQNQKLEPTELAPIIMGFMPPGAPPLTQENCLAFCEVFDRNGDKVGEGTTATPQPNTCNLLPPLTTSRR